MIGPGGLSGAAQSAPNRLAQTADSATQPTTSNHANVEPSWAMFPRPVVWPRPASIATPGLDGKRHHGPQPAARVAVVDPRWRSQVDSGGQSMKFCSVRIVSVTCRRHGLPAATARTLPLQILASPVYSLPPSLSLILCHYFLASPLSFLSHSPRSSRCCSRTKLRAGF